jgi:hypothetical protein
MLEDHYPDFSGKHVNVYVTHRHGVSYLLQDANFEMQAGRIFLVGRVSDAYSDDVFGKGKNVCIAWDYVQQYLVFDSAEEWRNEADAAEIRREKRYADAQQRRKKLYGLK